MALDTATLGLMFLLLLGVLGGLLILSWALHRGTAALAWWGASFELGAAGIACVSLGQGSPGWQLLLAGNGLVAGAYACQYMGCRVFNNRSASWLTGLAGPLLWVGTWPLIGDSFDARLAIMTLIVVTYNGLSAWELAQHARQPLKFQRVASVLFATNALFHALRGLVVVADVPFPWASSFDSRWSAQLALVLLLYAPSLAFVLISMAMERAQERVREATLQLRSSEERYRLLADNATDMIVLTNSDGVRQYVSPACRDIVGYEPEELIGRPVTERVHPQDAAASTHIVHDLFRGNIAYQTLTYRARHKAGHWVWLETRRRILRDEKGNPHLMLSVVRDISERVALEDRLRQAQKMEAVGQLTGGVAHDFNNLLTVVIGHTERLVADLHDPDLKDAASEALEAAERGAHLTRQLLSFGRRQSLKPEPLVLSDVVSAMAPLLRRTIGEHVELRTLFDGGGQRALTDRALLESAILNLVLNARDAMPDGGTLTIRTGERMASVGNGALPIGQPVVFLSVTDTGTGMPPEVLAKVFEPFFTTKDVGKGSGLGLSMVYGFAQQSGGHVAIESQIGQGTRVTILLLAAGAAPVDTPRAIEPTIAPKPGTESILVVEDEPQVLQFVSSQLTSLGYSVTGVQTAVDALDLLRGGRSFDLILTDVVLPKGMSGVELAREAKQLRPGLRALLTSGYPTDAFGRRDAPVDTAPLLRKPYRRKELARELRRVLDA